MSPAYPDGEPPNATFDHANSGRRYRVYREDGKIHHRESLPLAGGGELTLGDHPLAYLVGSGRFARTYLVEDAGFLVESPVTWYESQKKWDMSPGFDRANHRSFHRPVEYDCLYCHAGSAVPIDGNEHRVHLGELAIGCERCHGPGSLHVARWSASGRESELGPEGDRTIVHPRRLPRELAEAVCHQCHLTTDIQIAVRGRSAADFRPALRWQDFVINYDDETAPRDMTVVGHVAQLRQSRCYQASERLTCITCHAGHGPVDSAARIAQARDTCQACHAEPSCGLAKSQRVSQNDNDCAACHMPRSLTDVPHVAFTHHRIAVHRPSAESLRHDEPKPGPLAAVLDISQLPPIDREQSLGLAYLQRYRNLGDAGDKSDLEQARLLIESTAARGLLDARQTLALAELAAEQGDLAAAERWSHQTLQSREVAFKQRVSALRLLSGIALRANRNAEAAEHLSLLTTLVRDPRDWMLLGVCRQRLGDAGGAIAAFERVLEIDAAQPETYEMLAPLYAAAGDPQRGAWCRTQAELIRQAVSRVENGAIGPAPSR